jgi:hypothetical protein
MLALEQKNVSGLIRFLQAGFPEICYSIFGDRKKII